MIELAARLHAHGLAESTPVVLHTNRRVLLTLTPRGALRVHRGYQAAPDEVVAAIARWARPRTRRADRLSAQRILLTWSCHPERSECHPERSECHPERSEGADLQSRDRPRPEDAPKLARLHSLWAELNARHFGATLGPVEIRLSRRMRRRLGEFRPANDFSRQPEIAIGLRHLTRDGWARAADTLLHEMVHQWQAETGRPLAHGREFRDKCAALGIEGRAMARLGTDIRRYLIPSSNPGAPSRECP